MFAILSSSLFDQVLKSSSLPRADMTNLTAERIRESHWEIKKADICSLEQS